MSYDDEIYNVVTDAHPLVRLDCWTHCRWKSHEVWRALPKDRRGPGQFVGQFIVLIGMLYQVEAQVRQDSVDPAERGRCHQ